MLKDRPTIDVVVIMMTVMVGVVLLIATIGVITIRALNPQVNLSGAEGAVGNILTTVVGALVGLIGGRAAGRLEANGGPKDGKTS